MTATLHVVFGPTGAGKSTYAKALARSEPAVHFAIDDWITTIDDESGACSNTGINV